MHVAGYDRDALVGTVRLVLPAAGRRLPVEEAFGLEIEPRGALFGRAWLETRARGHRILAGAASPRLVARLRALGLPFEILGPARLHRNQQRHPVRLDPATGERPGWYSAPAGAGTT